jgi:hypothetical protein
VLGPLLLLLLLPAGYVAVRLYPELRDPSWRLLVGIALALFTRILVSPRPTEELPSIAGWIVAAILPTALGVALWWRGSATTVAEMTAAEIRTEFGILAVCGLGVLALMRPFVLPDPLLLVGSVVLFAAGGLLANALGRQDAADAATLSRSRPLAILTAVLPCVAAAILVGVLRPQLLGEFWDLFSHLVELLLTPIGLLLSGLASLLPRPGPIAPGTLPPPPPFQPLPNPGELPEVSDQARWVATAILFGLALLVAMVVLVIVKLMLDHWLQAPPPVAPRHGPELQVESSGGAGRDLGALFAWLWRWLRTQIRSGPRPARNTAHASHASAADAWAAYRALLDWAAAHGQPRRPAETMHQLQSRLVLQAPDLADEVALVTTVYESERYGDVHPPGNALRRLARAIESLRGADQRR